MLAVLALKKKTSCNFSSTLKILLASVSYCPLSLSFVLERSCLPYSWRSSKCNVPFCTESSCFCFQLLRSVEGMEQLRQNYWLPSLVVWVGSLTPHGVGRELTLTGLTSSTERLPLLLTDENINQTVSGGAFMLPAFLYPSFPVCAYGSRRSALVSQAPFVCMQEHAYLIPWNWNYRWMELILQVQ